MLSNGTLQQTLQDCRTPVGLMDDDILKKKKDILLVNLLMINDRL